MFLRLSYCVQTLYVVKSEVTPSEGEDYCTMGAPYQLQLRVKDVSGTSPPMENFLMYEVVADNTIWALSGKTSGEHCIYILHSKSLGL